MNKIIRFMELIKLLGNFGNKNYFNIKKKFCEKKKTIS